MRILLTGGTGFIGQALVPALLAAGHNLLVLSRQARADAPDCRYVSSLLDIEPTEQVDAVINLAGASLAARRWTPAYRAEIVDSRVQTTRQLLQCMQRLARPPRVLISASAIGFYGHGEEQLTETSPPLTSGFAQRLCADWEAEAMRASDLGVRVCLLRIGVVLDGGGGALVQMARSFRLGVSSWLGSGRQWLSWVHRADVVAATQFLLDSHDLQGPFNLTAPYPVTAREFCTALGRHHRTLISAGVPGPVARLLVGEMADELLLNGQRVLPRALLEAGFTFRYPDIHSALDAIYAPRHTAAA